MMKNRRILYITTIGSTMDFFKSLIKDLIDSGNIVDIATNESEKPVSECFKEWGCKVFPISTSRSPFSVGNVRAVKQIKAIAKDYDIVHCHTPLAAAAARIACKGLRKHGLKVIYTAHGFHFYKGAPLKNWLIYYPIEKLCAHWTDAIITINKEDFELSKNKLSVKKCYFTPGVGIDTGSFSSIDVEKDRKRKQLGIPASAFLLLSVGELNENKNHRIVIEALSKIGDSNIHYMIAGVGDQKDNLEILAKKLGVNLHLLGYRLDVAELYKSADANVFPSIREGFGLAAIEGMTAGVPTICAMNRGTLTFGIDKVNCLLFNPFDSNELANAIKTIKENPNIGMELVNGFKADIKKYDSISINPVVINVYNQLFNQ